MSRFMSRLFDSFGNLLDVSPRGATCSRKRVGEARRQLALRSDADSIESYFKNIGGDMAFAMKQCQNGKKQK